MTEDASGVILADSIPGNPPQLCDTETSRESSAEDATRLVVESIPGLVGLLTSGGEVQFVNHQILEYTGQTLEELKGWGTNGTVHPEDLSHVIDAFTRSIGSGSPYEIVQRLRRSDGVYRWFQNNGFPIRDTSGQILRWCVLLTDIDERKRAEDALRESERELRLIVDSIPGLVAAFTPVGEVEFVNRQILEYFGRTSEELKHWGTGGMTHPEDLPRVVELFTHSMVSGDPFEFEVHARRFDGVYRWFQSRGFPLRDTNGQIVRWYNLLIDIDERKRAEQELRRSEEELRRSAAFLAEAQQLSRVGSFSWRLATDEIVWSEQLHRIFEIDRDVRVTFEAIGARVPPRRPTSVHGTDRAIAPRRQRCATRDQAADAGPHGQVRARRRPLPRRSRSTRVHRRRSGRDTTATLRTGTREGPIGTRLRRQGHEPRSVDGLDRARSQPAACGHHHEREYLSANAG